MKFSFSRTAEILLLTGMIITGIILYPSLPAQMPSHWGMTGEIDGWMTREMAVVFIPVLTIAFAVFLPWLERFDPEKKRYPEFRQSWEFLQVILVAFFTYVYGLQLYASLNVEFSSQTGRAMIGGIGVLFALMGYTFASIKRNYFIGIRTPWTLSSDRVWDETHAFSSVLWMIVGGMIVLESILWINQPWSIFFCELLVVIVVPIMYSYFAFRNK